MNDQPEHDLQPGTTSGCALDDLDAFRLDGDYAARALTRRVRHVRLFLTKELKDRWVHIQPLDTGRATIGVLEHEGVLHLVVRHMMPALKAHLGHGFIHAILTTQGELGLWWLPRRWPGKAQSSWNDSAVEIATAHAGECVRLHSVTGANVYEVEVANAGATPAPQWPEMDLLDLLGRAFGSRVIGSEDHPVAKALLAPAREP